MGLKLANNATSLLAGSISASSTTVQVRSGDGPRFPILAAGEWFPATIVAPGGETEIIRITARNGDTFTVERGQEGTLAQEFSAGSIIELRLTAGMVDRIMSDISELGSAARENVGTDPDELPRNRDIPYPFPKGTRMLFQQSAAPPSWAKVMDHDDAALRVVSGTAETGGSKSFSTAFSERMIERENLPNITLHVEGNTSDVGDHGHLLARSMNAGGSSAPEINANSYMTSSMSSGNPGTGYSLKATDLTPNVGWTGSGGAHGHEFSADTESLNGDVQQTPLDFKVKYVDVIIAEKD